MKIALLVLVVFLFPFFAHGDGGWAEQSEWRSSASTTLIGQTPLTASLAKFFASHPPASAALSSSFAEFIYEMEEDNRYTIPVLRLQLRFDESLGIHFLLSTDGEAALIESPHDSLDYHSHRLINDLECCEKEKCNSVAKKVIVFNEIPMVNASEQENVTEANNSPLLLTTIQATIQFTPLNTENCTSATSAAGEDSDDEERRMQMYLEALQAVSASNEDDSSGEAPAEYGIRECALCSWARKAQFFFHVFQVGL